MPRPRRPRRRRGPRRARSGRRPGRRRRSSGSRASAARSGDGPLSSLPEALLSAWRGAQDGHSRAHPWRRQVAVASASRRWTVARVSPLTSGDAARRRSASARHRRQRSGVVRSLSTRHLNHRRSIDEQGTFEGNRMSRMKMIGWLSAAAMAAAGLSTMTATAAFAGEKGKGVNKAYIVQMADHRSPPTAAASRATRRPSRQGPEDRPECAGRGQLHGLSRRRATTPC